MAKYSVGIDLGTTHGAVSFFELERESGRGNEQDVLLIPQLTSPGVVEFRSLLPSFAYLSTADEFPAGSFDMPWKTKGHIFVGEFARSHGSKVPTRLVSSAKSWLCHSGVDRKAAILPWQAPAEVQKISPLEASSLYLKHLVSSWNHSQKMPLQEQDVVLTVPASFDPAARELTIEAARLAGLEHVTLLEEPQAALYSWLEAMGEGFRKQVSVGDVILVVDVGGGTTDFSLIAVTEQEGELQLTRLAVGDHILLGGDNMDLALAYTVNQKLGAAGKKLDAWQLNSLTHACRQGKEKMFSDGGCNKFPISIASRGSALIGGTIKAELLREELEKVLTEGFFPRTKIVEQPQMARRSGLAQMGLPYAQDAAVTRHLAGFLKRQAASIENENAAAKTTGHEFVHPSVILFNGGVLKAVPLRERIMETINDWIKAEGGKPARELQGPDLDLAVARGAAYYGWVRKGHGIRIRGGTARAYYVGVESSSLAVPGFEPPMKALCLAPFGMEEGTKAEIPPQEFGLVVGEPTQFRFFASSVRRHDKVGEMLDDVRDNPELEELAPIETELSGSGSEAGLLKPVQLQAAITELGTLELRCLEKDGPGRWKLELNVRMKE